MTALQIAVARVRQWAEFSGDYNPIHFDPHAARALGEPTVIAHGMIPVVLAFQRAYDATTALATGERFTCTAKMRRPILQDEAVRIEVLPRGRGTSFSILGQDGSARVRGTLSVETNLPAAARSSDAVTKVEMNDFGLSGREVRTRRARLNEIFPECHSSWLSLATCFFAEFLQRGLTPLRAGARDLGTWGATTLAVQTTYSVTALEMARSNMLDSTLGGDYFCAFEPTMLFAVDGGCAGEVSWTVSHDGCPALSIGVGLLLKTSAYKEARND